MHVGVCIINLRILESRSLKDKRRVIKSVKDRFNVSIAEVGLQNAYQSAVIGIVSVSSDQHHLNKVLSYVVTFVEKMHLVELVDYKIELAY
ncbi:MAG: DUF503 domain-containing protein [Candidatus Poribacteria bacterium]|nr:DUF503 domain-containing protein [Candidatus Poribacteria bacterium]